MEKTPLLEKINPLQLFILIFLTMQGSAIVVGIATEANEDAWIATAIATTIGVGLFKLYSSINAISQGKNLFQLIELAFGKIIAFILSCIYIWFFIYIAARVTRDFCELIITISYPNTPLEAMAFMFVMVVAYILYQGIEVTARTTETLFPYVTAFLALLTLFLYVGGNVHMKNIYPILAHGFIPVWKAIFPGLLTFPFGETFVFTVVMAYVSQFKLARKMGLWSVGITGFALSYYTFIKIAALGVIINKNSTFPLMSATRLISVAAFIERLDALVVFVMMIGIFVKVSVFLYASLKGIEYITNTPYRLFVVPICVLSGVFSVLIASNYQEHIDEGLKFAVKYISFPLLIVFPFLLYGVLWWKVKRKHKGGNH